MKLPKLTTSSCSVKFNGRFTFEKIGKALIYPLQQQHQKKKKERKRETQILTEIYFFLLVAKVRIEREERERVAIARGKLRVTDSQPTSFD